MAETAFDFQAFLNTLTSLPGVYRMVGTGGEVLYVGKARNLKKRVSSYFRRTGAAVKTQALMTQVRTIEVTVTRTEGEALLLENNLIKDLKPRYNVLLRDDKSYPYLHLTGEEDFPRLAFYRGARREPGRYFGPYPNAGAVRESLSLLQKLFRLRQCEDSFFRNRSRPCLQYQIERCSAPCVGLIDKQAYLRDVRHAVLFLQGKSRQVTDELVARMDAASKALAFEEAARLRDQIASLRRVQEQQYVSGTGGDLDVVAAAAHGGLACVQVFYIRGGRNLGNKTLFPQTPAGASEQDVLAAFLPQYYLDKEAPPEILITHALEDAGLLEQVLSARAGRRVRIIHRVRGERARWRDMAVSNAELALGAELSSKASLQRRFEALQDDLGLEAVPARVECFDISHTLGEATVASCVVFVTEGPLKSDYRRFNIEGVAPGDDYGALHQALSRRYARLKQGEGRLPDVLFIDGGKGQVAAAQSVLEELQVQGVTVIGID